MQSPSTSPTSTRARQPARRARRRGYSLIETLTAATLVLLVISASAAILSVSSRITLNTLLQTAADQTAVRSINRMILDIREAKQVTIVSSSCIRIYYPVTVATNQYDRTKLDSTHYVQYALTTSNGTVSSTGTYLWRSTESSSGWMIASNVADFTATAFSASAVRLTLEVNKSSGSSHGDTTLDQRVIYLRNN